MSQITKAKLLELIAKQKQIGMHGEVITYNEQQKEFINLVSTGKSCVLIGAAGTGKTTCSRGGLEKLSQSGLIPILATSGHSYLMNGSPGIGIISFTRRAVSNIKKVLPDDLRLNCMTAHAILEYQPVYYDVEDPETGLIKTKMKFEPTRHGGRPLPSTLKTIVVEESSMLGTDLFSLLQDALPHKVQWIFIGDIQQLPPVFGPAILGFALLSLPVIELTRVYRQALESPIIRLAHHILSGKPSKSSYEQQGDLTVHYWKKKLSAENAIKVLTQFFIKAYDTFQYNPDEHMILIPYNKACGSIELNKGIANHIAKVNQKIVYEVISGFQKLYFSVSEKIMYDKEDAIILSIEKNPAYTGKIPAFPSIHLDYWGNNNEPKDDEDIENIEDFLNSIPLSDNEDRTTQASHRIRIKMLDTDKELELSSAGDINSILLNYSMTVHKAQGSEWKKVFLCLHQSHNTMLSRELLYTAVTRAREELYIICEPESIAKGIKRPRIKGNTLAEKAEYFKGKQTEEGKKHVYKF